MNHRKKPKRRHDYSISVDKSLVLGGLVIIAVVLAILFLSLMSS